MNSYDRRANLQELDTAIEVGREVYYCLKRAEEKLDKAADWGLVDIFFANFITSSLKHRRIADANAEIEQARGYLRQLSRTLDHTVLPESLNVEVNQITRIADVAFASRVMDVFFQNKINDSIEQIQKSREQVKIVVKELKEFRKLEAAVVAEVVAEPVTVEL